MSRYRISGRPSALFLSLGMGAAVLAGCGSTAASAPTKTASSTTANTALAFYANTTAQKSFDISLVETISLSGHAAESINLSGSESLASGSPVAKFVTSLPAPLSGTVSAILIGGVEYISLPASAASAVPAGIKWLSINVKQAASSILGASSSNLLSGATADPASILSFAKYLNGGLTKVGTATVGGVPTTEYSGGLDLAKGLGKGASSKALAILKSIGGSKPIPIYVWADSSGLLRQMKFSFNISGSSIPKGTSANVEILVNISNFGVPVTVSVPPASEVMPISKALG